ncbi:8919_t:CDS:2 [Entrophospora sp. SA101]|nr:8919_t:CDS:2 [Entrophospora sp. SA101]
MDIDTSISCQHPLCLMLTRRVESRSTGRKTISQYLAKYLSKSFHLRNLYQAHGLHNKNKTYRFFKNLYEYQERKATVSNGSKQDFLTGRYLAPNQHIFKRQDNTYYYRANEQLIGHCAKPLIIKKSYRLGYHSLSTLPLCQLAQWTKPSVSLAFRKKAAAKITPVDFQEYLITSLLLFCKKAEFINLPLEKEKVPQTQGKCDQLDYTHFQKMPTLRFKFAKENANLARIFMENLDNQAQEFDIEEKQGFIDSRFPNPTIARNAYLNQ